MVAPVQLVGEPAHDDLYAAELRRKSRGDESHSHERCCLSLAPDTVVERPMLPRLTDASLAAVDDRDAAPERSLRCRSVPAEA
jgi:hypothetical protein